MQPRCIADVAVGDSCCRRRASLAIYEGRRAGMAVNILGSTMRTKFRIMESVVEREQRQ